MISFRHLKLFVTIAEKGSLTLAARELGLSPSSVTERLNTLEKYFNTVLFIRTTRSISLTEEGDILLNSARSILELFYELENNIRISQQHLKGNIKVSIPSDLGRNRILPIIKKFMEVNPNIGFDISFCDEYIDMIATGTDVAVRYGLRTDARLYARLLNTNKRIFCAAPSYLKNFDEIKHPEDLTMHNCLRLRLGGVIESEWPFIIDGHIVRKLINGNFIANDGEVIRQICINGLGIAYEYAHDIVAELNSGRLVEILSEYNIGDCELNIVTTTSHKQPERVRQFIHFLIEKFNDEPCKETANQLF